MWDDLKPYLVGSEPTATVLDPDGTPNFILDVVQGGAIKIGWSFSGAAKALLNVMKFIVNVYADPVGLGSNALLGTVTVDGTTGPNFTAVVNIPPNSIAVGAYRLTTLNTTDLKIVPPQSLPIAGFVDGPIIQVRPGP